MTDPFRKLTSILGAFTLAATVAACSRSGSAHSSASSGDKSAESQSAGNAQAASATTAGTTQPSGVTHSNAPGTAKVKSIQFVDPLPNFPAFKQISGCMNSEARAKGIDYTESGPSGQAVDANVMIQQIQQAISAKKGAIVTVPESAGFTPILQQAQKAGITTATFYGPGGSSSGADTNISVDWAALGKLYVDTIKHLPGQQKVGLFASGDTGFGKQWSDGVKAAAAATPNVKVVGLTFADDASKALALANALLTAHPDINWVFSNTGLATPGVDAAIKSQSKLGKVKLIGQGYGNGGSQALKDGTAGYLLMQGYCQMGKDTVDAVVDASNGKPKPTVLIDTAMATKATLQSYINKQYG